MLTTPDTKWIKEEVSAFILEYRALQAESILKEFNGELTSQILVALNIAEKRLQSNSDELIVTESEWEILEITKDS